MTDAVAPDRACPDVAMRVGLSGLLAAGLYAAVGGLATVAAVISAQPSQHFTSLVAGALAFGGGGKLGDLVALPLGVAVAVLVGLQVTAALRAQPDDRSRAELTEQLLWWSCPGAIAMGALVLGQRLSPDLAAVTLAAGLLMAAETVLSRRAGRTLPPRTVSMSVLGCVLWSVAPLALVVAASRTTLGVADLVERTPWIVLAVGAGMSAGLLELYGAWRGRDGIHAGFRWFVAAPACVLPLLVLALYPARLRLADGTVDAYDTSPPLLIVCWVVASLGVAVAILQLRRHVPEPGTHRVGRTLPPVAVLSLIVAAMFGTTRPPVITGDDYHYGETLIGWFRYRAGDLPYLDHQPAHGLVQDDLAAFLASVFFDGSAAAHTEATRLSSALLASLIFAVVLWATRSQLLAVVATLVGAAPIISGAVPMGGLTWAFLVAMGWLLTAPRLRERPQAWLVVWLVAIPVVVMAAPAQGLVLLIAATALAIISVGQVWAAGDVRPVLTPVVAALLVAVVAFVTPLGAMMAAALRYVLSNAEVNAAAYGIPWDPNFAGGGTGTTFTFDVLRMLWTVGLVLCSLIALTELQARRWRSEVLAQAVFFALVIGGALPYVMGRVDAGEVSRAGLATAFVLALVVPALAWVRLSPTGRALTAAGLLTAASGLFGAIAQPTQLISAAQPFVASSALVDGSTVGLPGWGRAAPADLASLDQTIRLGEILDAELVRGAPYYDATSRNAQYYYLGRRPPVAVTAAYNTPLPEDQRRTIREIGRARAQVAVLRQPLGNIENDGGGLALRTPLLAQYLEKAYTPYERDGFILGQWGRKAPTGADPTISLALDDLTDDAWDRGVSRTSQAIRLDDATAALFLEDGTSLVLPDGSTRRVTSTQPGGVVELDGPVADALMAGERTVTVATSEVAPRLYRAWLFERSFGRVDLARLPASWGASLGAIDGISEVSDVAGDGRLDSLVPTLRVDLPSGVEDDDVDLMSFDVQCEDEAAGAPPDAILVGWEGARTFGDAPGRTLDVISGQQLVPLDSSAYWRAGLGVEALTFTITRTGSCSGIAVSHIVLWERTD